MEKIPQRRFRLRDACRDPGVRKNVPKQTFEVTTIQDVIDEMDETFLVKLSMARDTGGEPAPAIADGMAVGTITDNDDAPTKLTISVDTNEDKEEVGDTIAETAGETTVTVTAEIASPRASPPIRP